MHGDAVARIETPPLARGRPPSSWHALRTWGKHPRLRGEDPPSLRLLPCIKETPPLARGRLAGTLRPDRHQRNTPAYAGKTEREDGIVSEALETPPLARGRPAYLPLKQTCFGNTPACAGKTWRRSCATRSTRKHPRLRGEDSTSAVPPVASTETPPLARGRPPVRS